MNQVKQLREYTRELECHLANMNQSDCCQCGVNTSQCFLLVEIGRKPGICVKDLAEAMCPGIKTVEVGIRPGEKLDEIMVTTEDAPFYNLSTESS